MLGVCDDQPKPIVNTPRTDSNRSTQCIRLPCARQADRRGIPLCLSRAGSIRINDDRPVLPRPRVSTANGYPFLAPLMIKPSAQINLEPFTVAGITDVRPRPSRVRLPPQVARPARPRAIPAGCPARDRSTSGVAIARADPLRCVGFSGRGWSRRRRRFGRHRLGWCEVG